MDRKKVASGGNPEVAEVGERPRFSGAPITDDDATIEAMLADVSVPTLLMSMVHMTGDIEVLRTPDVPAGIYLNEVQGFMDPESQERVRQRALEVIKEYRDGGCVLPPAPDEAMIAEMMRVQVATEVPERYVPMMLEELGLDGDDARRHDEFAEVDPTVRAGFRVVVIGAGMSGLLTAIRLEEAGISYTVVEKNPAPGGTWFENRYPGARVDVGNHYYCYSFAPNDEWTKYFAEAPELQAYFEKCMHDFDVADKVRFSTEVSGATWNEESGTWTVEVVGADGEVEQLEADALISAVGQLNRPSIPDFEGLDSFGGTAVHSAQWDPDIDLAGKRVAVIGTGASALQIVPTIADEVAQLTVFQRSAPWMFHNPDYHKSVGEGTRWALQHLPYYGRWYRFLILWPACDGGFEAMLVDPEWEDTDRAVSAVNDAAREFFTSYLVDQIDDDPDLAAKVVPDYVCLGKRTLQDDGSWLRALQLDHVDLVTDAIERITPTGLVSGGSAYEFDVIVFATGFHANRYLWPMDIRGRSGQSLRERWGDEPSALYGVAVPDFPNLFCIYGPGTNLASGGSMIFHSECEVRYTMGLLSRLMAGGHRTVECTEDALSGYLERFHEANSQMSWSHESVRNSWYKNDSGVVYVLSPWRLIDFWTWTREPDPAHYAWR